MCALRSISFGIGLLAAATLIAGCAGYQIGTGTLYYPHIRTVHVPMFDSGTYRRTLGERLTEAVVKEIESHTTFKVVHDPSADSTLTGRIVRLRKRVLSENFKDEPNNLELDFKVRVTWMDRQGQPLFQRPIVILSESTNFIPEAGQTFGSSQQDAVQRIARQIVWQMERPW